MKIISDLLVKEGQESLEKGKESLEEAFEKYKYWLQSGPEIYANHFKIAVEEKGSDWRAHIRPYCEYYPEKELSVLTDTEKGFEENEDEDEEAFAHRCRLNIGKISPGFEDEETFVHRCRFHKISYGFIDSNLPIVIYVESKNGLKNCCRDPIEWFVYLCKIAIQRRTENALLNSREMDLWKGIINWLFEKICIDKKINPKAEEEYNQNKDLILYLNNEIGKQKGNKPGIVNKISSWKDVTFKYDSKTTLVKAHIKGKQFETINPTNLKGCTKNGKITPRWGHFLNLIEGETVKPTQRQRINESLADFFRLPKEFPPCFKKAGCSANIPLKHSAKLHSRGSKRRGGNEFLNQDDTVSGDYD